MRIVVDTSVWSAALRRPLAETAQVQNLAELLSSREDVFLTGFILQEVLQAYRSDVESRRVEGYLRTVPRLVLDREGYVEAASIYRRCAARGIAASTADSQIAAATIRHDCKLLTADSDFERIAEVSTLELL